jgi:hypothetical protein
MHEELGRENIFKSEFSFLKLGAFNIFKVYQYFTSYIQVVLFIKI